MSFVKQLLQLIHTNHTNHTKLSKMNMNDNIVFPTPCKPSGNLDYLNNLQSPEAVYADFLMKNQAMRVGYRLVKSTKDYIRLLVHFMEYVNMALGRIYHLQHQAQVCSDDQQPPMHDMLALYRRCADAVVSTVLQSYRERCNEYTQHIVRGAAFCQQDVNAEIRFIEDFKEYCQDVLHNYGKYMTANQRKDVAMQLQLCDVAHATLFLQFDTPDSFPFADIHTPLSSDCNKVASF